MSKIRAVVFDAYGTLFDVYSVTARAEQLFPGKGEALALLWRERQIDYSRLRSLAAPDGRATSRSGTSRSMRCAMRPNGSDCRSTRRKRSC
jgi:HAD superfamily hydrolase (TIGR01493 family)